MALVLADFLCAIRCTVVPECLIVEIVTTCAACMRAMCCMLVLCPPGMLRVTLHPTHSYRTTCLCRYSVKTYSFVPSGSRNVPTEDTASREVSREGCNSVVLILADVLCAIRVNVFLACLIVEIVTTCAACMGHLCESHIFGYVPNGHTDTQT